MTTTTTQAICNINVPVKTPASAPNATLVQLFETAGLETRIITAYTSWIAEQPELRFAIDTFFKSPASQQTVPLFIYNEEQNNIVTLFASKASQPSEPDEPGSILAYVRANGFTDKFLCSDCFGQLSCSSCAVEILAGQPKNPTPREEEYDMLDIDEQKPPTEKTRLGCQTVVGEQPLVIMIRKSNTQI